MASGAYYPHPLQNGATPARKRKSVARKRESGSSKEERRGEKGGRESRGQACNRLICEHSDTERDNKCEDNGAQKTTLPSCYSSGRGITLTFPRKTGRANACMWPQS